MVVKFSTGNSKMGKISSVSLPSVITCKEGCKCSKKCYAQKIERIRKNVRESYKNNLDLYREKPDQYWDEINRHLKMVRFFRLHVSGDFPDYEYFLRSVSAAENNPACEILCFTKKYELVNEFVDGGGNIPSNLHIIFSVWPGMEIDNRYKFPEAHVRFKDGTTTASPDALECAGNCFDCAASEGGGCWQLKNGEQVVFNEH